MNAEMKFLDRCWERFNPNEKVDVFRKYRDNIIDNVDTDPYCAYFVLYLYKAFDSHPDPDIVSMTEVGCISNLFLDHDSMDFIISLHSRDSMPTLGWIHRFTSSPQNLNYLTDHDLQKLLTIIRNDINDHNSVKNRHADLYNLTVRQLNNRCSPEEVDTLLQERKTLSEFCSSEADPDEKLKEALKFADSCVQKLKSLSFLYRKQVEAKQIAEPNPEYEKRMFETEDRVKAEVERRAMQQ